jgi:cysteinyl-tRNA synthetase
MDDDFNTPEALAALFDLAGRINSGERALAPQLRGLAGLLGILQRSAEAFFQGGLEATEIEAAIQARVEARKRRDFAEADRIRKELLAKGVVLEDSSGSTTWRRA